MIGEIEFCNKMYKNNISRMNGLNVANTLIGGHSVKEPIIFKKEDNIILIKLNILSIQPSFIYDTIKKDIGFEWGTIDIDDLIPLSDIFEKYFNVSFSIGSPAGTQKFEGDCDTKFNFALDIIDRLYELSAKKQFINMKNYY